MKKILYFIILTFSFMFLNVLDANATSLSMKDLTLECIYSDGGLYTSAYSGTDEILGISVDKYVVNRTAYNLEGVDNNSANKGSAETILNEMFYAGNRCSPTLWYANIQFAGGNEDNNNSSDTPVDYYKFGSKIQPSDTNAHNSWWDYLHPWDSGDADKVKNAKQKTYNLVSERYILKSTAPEPNVTIYYMSPSTQVAGNNSYISILVYDNTILMEKDGRTTRLDGEYNLFEGITRDKDNKLSKTVPDSIYINSPEPQSSTNSSSTVSYSFLNGQKIYSVSQKEDSVHTNKYILTDKVPESDIKGSGALCDEILPNTSKILSKVIKWIQILVPVFLIILTALDIGKIVVTGNIEEELPKRKKIIMIRFVVAIVFFFLPLFVRMFTGWLIDSGAENTDSIEYIDCLFK